MVSALYGIAAFIVLIQLIALITKGGKTQSVYMLLLFVVTVICNLGYFAIAISQSVETAVLGNKITYFGAVFLPYLVLMTIAELCDTRLPIKIRYPLLGYSIIVLMLVFSTGYSDIYYKNVDIEQVYGVTLLVKEYGPAHNTYTILLLGEVAFSLYIVIRTFLYKETFSKKTVGWLLVALLVPSTVYGLERMLDSPIELLPFFYVIILAIYSGIQAKIRMYDMSSDVAGVMERMEEYGYITFDLRKNFMSCNSMALHIFPELKHVQVDANIEESDSVFYREIVQWIDLLGKDNSAEKKLHVEERYLKCIIRKIHNGFRKKEIGYSVELIDDTKQQNYINLLNNYNADLKQEVEEKTEHIQIMQESIVTGMASMIESRDNSTGGHIRRTRECVKILVQALHKDGTFQVPESFYYNLIKAAPMHDLGKIAIDDRILRKPGKFTEDEYELMKKHSEKGAEIVAEVLREIKDTEFVNIAINVANYHHEKWDGSGYPEGLKGQEIPLEARIMALADAFDTMVSKRYYKEAYSYDEAFCIIEESLDSHFDPNIGKVFLLCRTELEELYDSMPD